MTPTLTIRSFTNDQYILDKVFYSNFYKVKGFKEHEKKPVVLDIGGHCGYFTFAAMALGAQRVYVFEPFVPNYKVLLANVGDNPIAQVIPYQLGVYVAPVALTFGFPELIDKSYFDYSKVGMDYNSTSKEFCKCCVLPLDTILENYVGENIDLMKLSIGYAEMAVISASEKIKTMVTHLCGEITTNEAGRQKLKAILIDKGFVDIELYPIEGEENVVLFQASHTTRKDMFI